MDEKTSEKLRTRIITMLPELGKQAVRPYSVALQAENLQLVEWLAQALGRIQYPHALPQLKQAMLRQDITPDSLAGKAIVAAMISCGGGNQNVVQKSAAELWFDLGNNYYNRADSLQPDSRYPNEPGLVWFWKEGLGVDTRPVPREIFNDVYAMRCARMTLRNAPDFHAAVPLWLAAALRRQIELPEGGTDPLWPAEARQADYYALASSPRYLQIVLGRALNDADVPLATRVISTLGKTAGAKSLVATLSGGAQPLVEAMGYPDRAVRFLAAETLALARPAEAFVGSRMVLGQLNLAMRQTGKKYALVIVQDEELRNVVADAARGAGFEVVAVETAEEGKIAAEDVIGVDVIFVGPDLDPVAAIGPFRREAVYHYVPAVVNRGGSAMQQIAEQDGRMVLLDAGVNDSDAIGKALSDAVGLSAGQPLSPDQAVAWAIRAAKAIQVVALCPNITYDVQRSVDALVVAANGDAPELQIAAADSLAVISGDKAQRAIVALGLKSDADEQVRIAAFQAATRSVRQFGNQASDAQVQELVATVNGEGSEELLQAAAQLLGAMNLPSEQATQLIQTTDDLD
jgi:hypothetical protein